MEQSAITTTQLEMKAQDPSFTPNPEEQLNVSLQALEKFGGFELLESTIDGVQNINPGRGARCRIFLEEGGKKAERLTLKNTLQLWASVLNGSDDVFEVMESCREKTDNAERLLKKNLKMAIDQTKELEQSYRSVNLFYENTESRKVKDVSFINADLEQLKDLDNTRFIDAIHHELVENYDRLDLRSNYSTLVIPGYLGSNKVVQKWAKIAYENKAFLITDFENLNSPDDVMELFEEANLTGGDAWNSSVLMTTNWIVGRGKYNEVSEQEDLFVPASPALAGKIYNTLMSQVAAGEKYGTINAVDGVKFDLLKSDISNLEKLGLVPMVKEFEKVMAFSGKTLFNGDNIGLQTYSIVRVFDYVAKVLMHFLNKRAFENFTANSRKELNGQIVKFLDGITGPGKLVEDFSIKRFEQDAVQKDRIYLDIHLKPFFPAKTFLIKLDGQKGDDGNDWATEYEQKK